MIENLLEVRARCINQQAGKVRTGEVPFESCLAACEKRPCVVWADAGQDAIRSRNPATAVTFVSPERLPSYRAH
jgi:hypothetical protein